MILAFVNPFDDPLPSLLGVLIALAMAVYVRYKP
jgi:hypothetical protein